MERARIDFGGKDSNDAGIGLRRVCVESAEVSEGSYDEFRIRRRCEFVSEGKSKCDRIAGEMC